MRPMFDAYPDAGLFDRDVLVTDATYNFENLWLLRVVALVGLGVLTPRSGAGREVQEGGQGCHVRGGGAGEQRTWTRAQREGTPLRGQSGARVRPALRERPRHRSTAEELVDRFLSAAYAVRDNEFHDQGQD